MLRRFKRERGGGRGERKRDQLISVTDVQLDRTVPYIALCVATCGKNALRTCTFMIKKVKIIFNNVTSWLYYNCTSFNLITIRPTSRRPVRVYTVRHIHERETWPTVRLKRKKQ